MQIRPLVAQVSALDLKDIVLVGVCTAMLSVAGGYVQPADLDTSRVDVATDGAATAVTTWLGNSEMAGGADRVLRSQSLDFGRTWSVPTVLFHRTSDARCLLTAGVVYAGNGTWVSTWAEDDNETSHTQDIYISRSTDNGNQWSEPQIVLTEPVYKIQTTGSRFPYSRNKFDVDVASDEAGTIIASFESNLLRSTDFGLTWNYLASPITIGSVGFGTYGPESDTESKIAYCGNNKWVHTYARGILNPDVLVFRLYSSLSGDNGRYWTPPFEVSSRGSWIHGEEKFLGDLAADGNKVVVAYTGPNYNEPGLASLATASSSDAGSSWSSETHIPNLIDRTNAVSLATQYGKTILLHDNGGKIRNGRSLDYGGTWVGLPHVSDDPNAVESEPDVVAGPDSCFLAVYEVQIAAGSPNAGRHIQSARTSNFGSSWERSSYIDVKKNAATDWQLFE